MKVFGLTGGIGMGKSTSAEFLRARNIAVVDTDVLARDIVEPGRPALAEITALFGGGVIDASGALRRDRLAELVFADDAKRRQLEVILHPRIRHLWQQQIETWRLEKRPMAVVVIPLLYETDAAASFDRVICVACSAGSQRGRLATRGWSPEQIQQRNQAQWPVEKKMMLAHHVIWTEGALEVHAAQLERIIAAS